MNKLKNIKLNYKFILIIGYILLVGPILYSLFWSVPASDDFIYGSFVSSDNVIVNALAYLKYTFWTGSCRWVIFFFQKCINPLNIYSIWGVHVGHKYGAFVIVVFMVCLLLIVHSLRFIIGELIDDERMKAILVFLFTAILFSTYYYSEVYNWYTGATAYAVPFSFTLLLYTYIIRYFKYGASKKDYIMLFIIGLLPITNEFLCVPVGGIYLLYYIKNYKTADKSRRIKDIIPLVYYIIMGCTVVFSPGTLTRWEKSNVTTPKWRSILQAFINVIVRIKDIIIEHPLAVVLLLIIFFIGVMTKGKKNHDIKLYIVVFGLVIIGAMLPYCLGKGYVTTYMDVRMYYILDYYLLLSMCFLTLMFGQNFANHFDININQSALIRWGLIIGMFSYLVLIPQYAFMKIPQVDIIKKAGLIKENYLLWDGILSEIENSDEDDVVLTREKEMDWIPYFLYVGVEPENVYDQSFDVITPIDEIMINTYYKKKSIVLHYEK